MNGLELGVAAMEGIWTWIEIGRVVLGEGQEGWEEMES